MCVKKISYETISGKSALSQQEWRLSDLLKHCPKKNAMLLSIADGAVGRPVGCT